MKCCRLPLGLGLLAALAVLGCDFPPEIDTEPLNAHAQADLQAYADSGKCRPGIYVGHVGGGDQMAYTRECTVRGQVQISDDPSELLAMRHIQVVQGGINLAGATDLAKALPELQSAGLITAGDYKGKQLTGPPSLQSLEALSVEKNTALQSIGGFDGVKDSDWLRLSGNTALVSVAGFAQLSKLSGLEVLGNTKLQTWTALPSLAQSGAVTIKDNPALAKMPLFPKLAKVDGEIVLSNNLADAVGFPALTSAKALKIYTWPTLAELAFPELTSLEGLWLVQLPALTSLAGLPKVMVTANFSICTESVSCAELVEFSKAHSVGNPTGGLNDCGSNVQCKNP